MRKADFGISAGYGREMKMNKLKTAAALALCLAAILTCFASCESKTNAEEKESESHRVINLEKETEENLVSPRILSGNYAAFDGEVIAVDEEGKTVTVRPDGKVDGIEGDAVLSVKSIEKTFAVGDKVNVLINLEMQTDPELPLGPRHITKTDEIYFDMIFKNKKDITAEEDVIVILKTVFYGDSYAFIGSSTLTGAQISLTDKDGKEYSDPLDMTDDLVCVLWEDDNAIKKEYNFGKLPAGEYTVRVSYRGNTETYENAIKVK